MSDGTAELHDEEEAFAPLGVYGQSKAAGDIAVANCPRHYILRSSWVIGEGHNFVKTMMGLSGRVAKGELPEVTVVDDQYGRLHVHRGYGRGDLPPARRRRGVRHVRPDRFRDCEELGGHRV